MAHFRGRGGRGGGRGNFRGNARGASNASGRLARSGIRTRNGYKKFDSQRTRDLSGSEDGFDQGDRAENESELSSSSDVDDHEESDMLKPTVKAYNSLLQSFHAITEPGQPSAKRRKVELRGRLEADPIAENDDDLPEDDELKDVDSPESNEVFVDASEEPTQDEVLADGDGDEDDLEVADPIVDPDDGRHDQYERHFANHNEDELGRLLVAVQGEKWQTERKPLKDLTCIYSVPGGTDVFSKRVKVSTYADLPIKERLSKTAEKYVDVDTELHRTIASNLFSYTDVMFGDRSPKNSGALRSLACLHAVNHVLKGRDKVLRNNERLSHADAPELTDARDQGFVRPKVLILCETRQMAASYADHIAKVFQPDQQENRKRFDDAFSSPRDDQSTMPDDFRELFEGNNDNSFYTALKFTRKNMKFYSAFYSSDIILASPVGLRRIIENEDYKKRDYDFLSSIEIIVVDQADAMQMQSWENVEIVFKHLNLQLKEAHGCDFSRVRNWYLDGHARYLRQTVIFSAYITPEMNRLYNTDMLNIAGKAKIIPRYPGTITKLTDLGIKQTFSRFDCTSPTSDPDARFKYFTTAILPALLRIPKPADGVQGIMIFLPSYYDFLRLRNYFATSSVTENISFGTIHDYSDVSEQRRSRSHFLSGKYSVLLYTQRAHHFFRLRLRGVKRIVMYGVPDNEIFYREMVEGYLGTSINEGLITDREASMRALFTKWDGMKMERVVGTSRVKSMLSSVGDTFDFV